MPKTSDEYDLPGSWHESSMAETVAGAWQMSPAPCSRCVTTVALAFLQKLIRKAWFQVSFLRTESTHMGRFLRSGEVLEAPM